MSETFPPPPHEEVRDQLQQGVSIMSSSSSSRATEASAHDQQSPSVGQLRAGALGLPGVVLLCVAAIAPAASMLFNVPRIDYTQASRQIGRAAALALFFFGVAYVMITMVGLVSLKSPQQPIPDPFNFLMELLIVAMAPMYVAVMVAVHAYADRVTKIYSLMALALMIVCAAITSSVHFVMLTVSRQVEFTSVSWMPLFLSWKWPSVIYALDILAWDWFWGLSLLFAALVFKGGRLQIAVRIAMALSGVLSLAGLLFLPFGDMQLRMIGIFGYAGLGPVVFLLVAIVFGRARSRSQEAARYLGPESGSHNGRVHPQEAFKEDSFKKKHTV
jgi:hypothetical protein